MVMHARVFTHPAVLRRPVPKAFKMALQNRRVTSRPSTDVFVARPLPMQLRYREHAAASPVDRMAPSDESLLAGAEDAWVDDEDPLAEAARASIISSPPAVSTSPGKRLPRPKPQAEAGFVSAPDAFTASSYLPGHAPSSKQLCCRTCDHTLFSSERGVHLFEWNQSWHLCVNDELVDTQVIRKLAPADLDKDPERSPSWRIAKVLWHLRPGSAR